MIFGYHQLKVIKKVLEYYLQNNQSEYRETVETLINRFDNEIVKLNSKYNYEGINER